MYSFSSQAHVTSKFSHNLLSLPIQIQPHHYNTLRCVVIWVDHDVANKPDLINLYVDMKCKDVSVRGRKA